MNKYFLILKKDAESIHDVATNSEAITYEEDSNCFVIGAKRDVVAKIEDINDRLSAFILSLKEGKDKMEEVDDKVNELMQRVFIVNLKSKYIPIEKGDLSILQNMETKLIKEALNF